MPKVLFMDKNAVIIICEHIPTMTQLESANVRLAEQLEEFYCSNCGYKRDADLKAELRMTQSNGKQNFQISCFSQDKKELLLTGLRSEGKIK